MEPSSVIYHDVNLNMIVDLTLPSTVVLWSGFMKRFPVGCVSFICEDAILIVSVFMCIVFAVVVVADIDLIYVVER